MSKTLGFIHYIMFDKIKYQDSITDLLIDIAKDNNIEDIKDLVDSQGKIETGELEDIIDDKNIHSWIQERVIIVEKRFAKAVDIILEEDIKLKDEILKKVYEKGLNDRSEIKDIKNLKEIYGYIGSKFLDGMPCDRAIEVEYQDDNSLIYKINEDLHIIYWPEDLGKLYWDIRDEYIKGLLFNSKYNLYKIEEYRYQIK